MKKKHLLKQLCGTVKSQTAKNHLSHLLPLLLLFSIFGFVRTDHDNSRATCPGLDEHPAVPLFAPPPPPVIAYVNASVSGGNDDGTSWTDAYDELQEALAAAPANGTTEIWVAAGTYRPTAGTDRNISFVMKNNLAIYGGFAGTETGLGQRNWAANPTTLSGDIGTPGNNSDNSYHVIFNNNNGLNATSVLDGFAIIGGNADSSVYPGNFGGGMYNDHSSPAVTNCSFSGNAADLEGGGIYNFDSSSPALTNCSFSGNTASRGGAISNYDSSPAVTNCSFSGNVASHRGGGMYNIYSSPAALTNCSFSGNAAGSSGGGMFNYDSSPALTNCILWGNGIEISGYYTSPTVTHSIVQGGYAGTGNLNADPLFVSATDLHLQQCSPAIDAGTASGAPNEDLDGNARPFNATGTGTAQHDMGAYEFQSTVNICSCPGPSWNIVYVNNNATGGNTGKSWTDAFEDLQDALLAANTCSGVTEIWVAAGTYRPTAGTDRSISFVLKNGLAIYGGFAGTETGLGQRNWAANPTTLSGDIGTPGNSSDNSYHVIFNNNNGLNATAVLDGFAITGGNANSGSNPGYAGGGMYNYSSSPAVTNSSFSENAADVGGGIFNYSSSPAVTNSSFSGNAATYNGGGMFNTGFSSPAVTNCILWGNGTEIYNKSYASPAVTHSIVQGGYAGTGNLNTDPLFVSATDLHLQQCSPAIDAGTASGAPNVDLDGSPRPVDAAVNITADFDMGPYEFQGSTPAPVPACANANVQLNTAHTATVSAAQMNNNSTGCGTLSFLINGVASLDFDCDDVGAPVSVTLTVTDAFLNSATCTATITVEDNIAPVTTCKSHTVQLDPDGNASISPADVDGGSSDACGTATHSVSPNTFACADIGSNTVTLTVTDVNGNVNTCTATVTVQDSTEPSVTCKNKTVQLDVNGDGSIMEADVVDSKNDNCGPPNISFSQSTFSCDDIGTFSVTVTADDGNNNQKTCPATITVEDNTLPAANCISHTVQLDPDGNASISPADVDGGSSDACGNASLAVSPFSFACTNIGGNTITLTVTDLNGNVNTCTATVTVQDNTEPSVTCKNKTVQLDANGDGSILEADVVDSKNDNCGPPNISFSQSTFSCDDIGTFSVTVTADDGNNNQKTCPATITVEDNALPVANCISHTVQLDPDGNASISPADVDGGSSDACGNTSLAVSPSSFACTNIGGNTIILTVTDLNGNVNTCTATVTVQDNIDPSITCKSKTVQLDGSGDGSITEADVVDSKSDNCGPPSISFSRSTFDCDDIGTVIVTVTADDGNNNQNTCTATVSVEDNIDPSITCKNKTVELDANGDGSIMEADVVDSKSDNCGPPSISFSRSTFDCDDIGTVIVTVTADDGNGNQKACPTTVTVEDNIDPSVTCKSKTVELDSSGDGSIIEANVVDSKSDNCGPPSISFSQSTFDCDDIGTVIVTVTADDGNGNQKTCTATVTVEDNAAPAANCKAHTVQLDLNGSASITEDDIDDGSTDACGIGSRSLDTYSFSCANVGSNTVTLTLTDNHGNVETCMSTVTVEDDIVPQAICQSKTVQLDVNGDASVTAAEINDASWDACGIMSISLNETGFDCSEIGSNPVTLTVMDENGNLNTCTATVTVEDNVSPNAACKNHTVQLNGSGGASIVVADINDGSNDACGIASTAVSQNSFACANTGTNTVVLSVEDNNGNVSTCNATVTVEDSTDPVATCQNISIELDATGNNTVDPAEIDDGSNDICGIQSLALSQSQFACNHIGANTVTLTVTDNNSNQSTCTATVTVGSFVVITDISTTDETCIGMADGSITITATAPGGTLAYSIDNGINYRFSNVFSNVSPGSYDIKVLAQGTSGCAETGAATIGSGPSPSTWYKDMDGDGYTDGITQSGCTQPAGYMAANNPGDCNDNDANQYPGQTWYEDLDGDLYGNGTSLTACQRPVGCYFASELTATEGDCNESDPAICPGVPEICNGIDDDCDGEIDEGTSGGLTWTGNVAFYSQADVDTFSQCYSIIDGSLTIMGAGITNLSNLENLEEVTGNLTIQYTGLADLAGLDVLNDTGGTLTIYFNSSLASLAGLEALASVGGSLMMYYNFALGNCCAIYGLLDNGGVTGAISIFVNAAGCNSQSEILTECVPANSLVAPTGNSNTLDFEAAEAARLLVYPNPANNVLQVQLYLKFQTGNLQLFNVHGQLLKQQKLTTDQQRVWLDVHSLEEGFYFLQVSLDGERFSVKVLIE